MHTGYQLSPDGDSVFRQNCVIAQTIAGSQRETDRVCEDAGMFMAIQLPTLIVFQHFPANL